MNLNIALEFVNNILTVKVARELRKPEVTIFIGTWRGMTYEQMANSSSYSPNYLMRDVAPKFWKLLSTVFEENVGKSNFRHTLENLYIASQTEQNTPENFAVNQRHKQKRDWGNASAVPSFFYGRNNELKVIGQWLEQKQCQLLKLWGLSGVGKTVLMKKIGEQVQEQYEVVIWKSLAGAPTLQELVKDLLHSGFQLISKDETKLLSQLITQMQSRPCLIMLDGMEAILQPQAISGQYRHGYEDYDEFFRILGESSHCSCVIVTCLENSGRTILGKNNASSRNLKLSGLSASEAQSLLEPEQVSPQSDLQRLIEYYQGNPEILLTVAQVIRELFNGNAQEFLSQKSLVFGKIEKLLSKSFCRLSALEKEILYWLASEPQPMSLSEIKSGIPLSIYDVELIQALESLNQRSLIEINQIEQRSVFILSPMMREFVTNQFIAQIGNHFSLANRQNSSWSDNTIELSNKTQKPTHLSQWLQNRFESNWQPVETLFLASQRSPARLRSTFNLRGEEVIKRFRKIDLDSKGSQAVLLLIAISQEESACKICVQAQPTFSQPTLPANLELSLVDPSQTVLARIKSKAQDNFIQLPYFRGLPLEQFNLSLSLDSITYEEEFVI